MRQTGIFFFITCFVLAAALVWHLLTGTVWPIYILAITCVVLLANLRHVQKRTHRFLTGILGEQTGTRSFEQMETAWRQQTESMRQIVGAIDKVGEDDQHLLSVTHLDGEAGRAIHQLQSKLGRLKVQEQRRIWAAQGIASLGEIRKDNGNLQEYAYQILSHLVKYVEANQGVFYMLQDDGTLERLAAYAYGRRRFTHEKVTLATGEGIVGQSVLERQMIFMTDVPVDYIKITSGLGEATPRCLVVAPLLYREEVFGVIELASFKKLPDDTVEFIRKASETIALELSGIRAQARTRKLLEQSQEEELRQSLREMQAAQRDMLRKEEELNQQLAATQKAMALVELERKKNAAILEGCMDAVISFNQQGRIEYLNKAAEEVFGQPRNAMLGHAIDELLQIRIEATDSGRFVIKTQTGNEVSIRTEINAYDNKGDEISLLLTATGVKMGQDHLFTLFAQKVSVDLF